VSAVRKFYLLFVSLIVCQVVFSQSGDYLQQLHQKMQKLSGAALGDVFFDIGNAHLNEGRTDSAENYFSRARQYAEEQSLPTLLCRSYGNLGLVRHRLDDYKGAMELYLKALEVAEQNKYPQIVARLHVNMGEICLYMSDTVKGLQQLQKAEQLLLAEKDSVSLPALYSIIANAYLNIKAKIDSADLFIGKTLTVCNTLMMRPNLSVQDQATLQLFFRSALLNKGYLQIERGQYSGARDTYAQLRKQHWQRAMPQEQVSYYNQMASICLKEKQYADAVSYADSGLVLGKTHYVPRFAAYGHEIKADAYKALGNYKEALANSESMFAIEDSLNSNGLKSFATAMEAKYELGKKDARIEELRKQGKLNTIIAILGIAAALAASFAFLMSNRARRLEKKLYAQNNSLLLNAKELERNRMQVRLMEVEQMALRAQMNPHFIFNSLNSIQYYVINRDLAGANKYISMLGSLIRLTLDNTSKELIPLSEELKYLTNYMELEKMRMQDKFAYEIKQAPEIDPEAVHIPPMLLQPIVENAIRHGIRHLHNGQGRIQIQIEGVPGGVRYTVTDNGVGRSAAAQFQNPMAAGKHQSKGLELLRKRLALMDRSSVAPSAEIDDLLDANGNAQGTRVVIVVPG
jgi:tetratricopeptide (TPR) repeat protein